MQRAKYIEHLVRLPTMNGAIGFMDPDDTVPDLGLHMNAVYFIAFVDPDDTVPDFGLHINVVDVPQYYMIMYPDDTVPNFGFQIYVIYVWASWILTTLSQTLVSA